MSGKIKFVKRGGAVQGIVPSTDLSASRDTQNPPDPIEKSRAQDLELPHEISVLYINPGADYQQGVQNSTRQTGAGVSVKTVSLPIVLNDTKAKQVADAIHYSSWMSRTTYKLQLSRKWARLEPTDIIQVEYKGSSLLMRIVSKNEDAAGIIVLECVAEDTSIYTQSGLGASTTNIDAQVVKIPVQTLIMFLDIPLLRDIDEDAGFYTAACGYRPGWDGCTLFKSSDSGASYSQVFSIVNRAVIGYAVTTLGNFSGGFIFDELNSVIVQVYEGTLSSQSEQLILSGSNFAVLGNELIQFKNAELIDANTYKLTGILRGCKGTEWAMSTHNPGERFVLADANTWRRISASSSEIGLPRQYKAVSIGTTIQQTNVTPFTNTAIGLECYSPVQVSVGRDGSNNLSIVWKRRARTSAEWRDYADIHLGEQAEQYEVDIFTDSTFTTVIRTLTTTTPSVSYSSANQITDFGVEQTYLYFKVYQLSALVGRGFPATNSLYIPRIPVYSTQWRIYVTARTNGRALTIAEIEMRGTAGGSDLCNGGIVSVSAESAPQYGTNAFDDNTGTNWQSGWDSLPQWIQYTFPTSVGIAQIAITPTYSGTDAPKDWKLQYYNGSIWVDYLIKTNDTAGWVGGTPKIYTI